MSRPKPIRKNLIEIGKRIRLIHTVAGNYELREGDEGTIVDFSRLPDRLGGKKQIWVRWTKRDSGGSFTIAVIEGEDRFIVLD
jgi:hypothetical protein